MNCAFFVWGVFLKQVEVQGCASDASSLKQQGYPTFTARLFRVQLCPCFSEVLSETGSNFGSCHAGAKTFRDRVFQLREPCWVRISVPECSNIARKQRGSETEAQQLQNLRPSQELGCKAEGLSSFLRAYH